MADLYIFMLNLKISFIFTTIIQEDKGR